MVDVRVTGGTLPQGEIDAYVEYAEKKFADKNLTAIDLEVDGEYVNAAYHFAGEPFQRIRRITGYLVGTLDRFNNAKRAEEADRVKHAISASPFCFGRLRVFREFTRLYARPFCLTGAPRNGIIIG